MPHPDVKLDLPDLDTGPIGLQHSSWVLALASRAMAVFVLSLCPCSLLCYSLLIVTAHPAIHVNGTNRAMYVFR